MIPLTVAIISGLIAFLAKFAFDIRAEYQARRGLAAALAGELGSYVRMMRFDAVVVGLRQLTRASHERRLSFLQAFPTVPFDHPVYGKAADKIGSLTPEAARGISEAYSVITAYRLQVAQLGSQAVIESGPEVQIRRINALARLVSKEIGGIRNTIAILDSISTQSMTSYLLGRIG